MGRARACMYSPRRVLSALLPVAIKNRNIGGVNSYDALRKLGEIYTRSHVHVRINLLRSLDIVTPTGIEIPILDT